MLTYPSHPVPYRVLGIDPGSVTLGVAVLDFDLDTRVVELIDAQTFDASKSLGQYRNVVEVHGERVARLLAHENGLSTYFGIMRPQTIVSESPYLGRFPLPFAALTECITAIRRAVLRYDPFMPLHMADPMTVKAAVGVHAKGRRDKDALKKEKVQAAVAALPLSNRSGIDLMQLDEHSIDAIAVAMSRLVEMQKP